MPADITGVKGYAVATQEGISSATGYAVATHSGAVSNSTLYAALSDPASLLHVVSYAATRYANNHVPKTVAYAVIYAQLPPYSDLFLEWNFLDVRFPDYISYGSSGGPGFKTSILTVDSGLTHTQVEWDRLRARYEVSFENAKQEDVDAVEDFFHGMRGKALGFRFKDWSDYTITNQNICVGDGKTKTFNLFKRYRSGAYYYDRPIKKPVKGSVGRIFQDETELFEGRDFYINSTTGTILFEVAPPSGAICFVDYMEYDVPVRFDTDELTIEAVSHNQYNISSLKMIEILV